MKKYEIKDNHFFKDPDFYLAKPPNPIINIFVQSRLRSVSRRSIKVTSVTLGGVGDTASLIFIFFCDACVTFVALHLILFILKKSQFLDWFAVLKLSFWFFGAREIRSQGRKDQILNCTLSPNSSLYSLEDRPTDTESYDSYPEAACICGVSVSNLKDSILKINRFDYLFKPYPTVDYFKTNWTIFLAVQSTRNASKFM